MWHIWIETGTTDGMFSKSVGFYLNVHLGKSPSRGCAPVTIKEVQSDFFTTRWQQNEASNTCGRS